VKARIEHYVSQFLLERFRLQNSPLECFDVSALSWVPDGRSTLRACSSKGYHQLIPSSAPAGAGPVDDVLEGKFQQVESVFSIEVLPVLEAAANSPSTSISRSLYDVLCRYCAFLLLGSPAAKAGALPTLLIQINHEIADGTRDLLSTLQIPEPVTEHFRQALASGRHVVVRSEDALQTVYRFWFEYQLPFQCWLLRNSHWSVFHSPLELPISDVGVVPIGFAARGLAHYLLPLGPRLLLEGLLHFDPAKRPAQPSLPLLRGGTLSTQGAHERIACICGSAISEVICSRRIPDPLPPGFDPAVPWPQSYRSICDTGGIKFARVVDAERMRHAGLQPSSDLLPFGAVSASEYRQFAHSFVLPG